MKTFELWVFAMIFIAGVSSKDRVTRRAEISQLNKTITATANEFYKASLFEIKDLTIADLTEDLDDFVAPQWIRDNFPVYQAGYDYDERPVWISEIGKMPIRKLAESGPKLQEAMINYLKQVARVSIKTAKDKNPEGYQVSHLVDFDGFKIDQIASLETTKFITKLARTFRSIILDYTEIIVVVNANYVTETLANLLRPVFHEVLSICEVHGTNRAKWLPKVLRHFPPESLPAWYGGSQKDFKPLRIAGQRVKV